MGFIGTFGEFVKRVMDAVKKGGLPKMDILRLDRLLNRVGKRNKILAQGLLSALSSGGASKKDIEKLAALLDKANQRIINGNKPFTKQEEKEIYIIFKNANLSQKTARWLVLQMDDFLNMEISEGAFKITKPKVVKFDIKKKEKKKRKMA